MRYRGERSELRGCCLDSYRVSYGVLAGVFGGAVNIYLALLSWKLIGGIACPWPFLIGSIWTWILIVIVVVFELGQLWWVNAGLKIADAKLIATLEIIANEYSGEAG